MFCGQITCRSAGNKGLVIKAKAETMVVSAFAFICMEIFKVQLV